MTSNVDVVSDALMQRVIRQDFADCTILAVAHRLETIIDFDRIAVLKDGELIEFDRPDALLKRDSAFRIFTSHEIRGICRLSVHYLHDRRIIHQSNKYSWPRISETHLPRIQRSHSTWCPLLFDKRTLTHDV
ncbi:uncharacterized protein TRUGW13939_08547 [Talaromyces rugulosus]|uniref:ABC transporter domain-containing protein n=1 Tax=Talaromyces rugulosus TaxID=121627 RepID=A0A7H8R4T8_TALRU|nr:uncharacterized protein TRUGW13939_08547 [Talaromyces rugulosus]QKX61399.1 hypothetical protein TRUGW13939_08547 [Talaromyces rugulosus]